MKKLYIKPIAAVLISAVIILSFSACSADKLKNIALGFLLGQPIQSMDAPDSEAEATSHPLVKNDSNYCIISGEYEKIDMKYTVTKAYELSRLSDAGLSLDDYSSAERAREYFSSDGELLDSSLTLVCVDLDIERLSDLKSPYADNSDPDICFLPNFYLFSQDYRNAIDISTVFDFCFYLEQTEDITRSDDAKEYIYYSVRKGQTAHAKLCFIIDKSNLTAPDICLYIQTVLSVTESGSQVGIAYIPITVETKNK